MFLDNILGAMIFQIVGASVRWVFMMLFFGIKGKKVPSFIEIYDGKEKDESQMFSFNAFLNGIIGIIFILGSFALVVLLGL